MVRPVSPLGGVRTPRQLPDAATIVHRRPNGGMVEGDGIDELIERGAWSGEGWLTPNNGAQVDERKEELENLRGRESEILNVDLGRIHARPRAGGTAAVALGLSTAHDLHAVHEDLGWRRYGGEHIAKRMRQPVIP